MTSKALLSSNKQNWRTPKAFFRRLDDKFSFGLDAAAEPCNALCERYITKEQDALASHWPDFLPDRGIFNVWLNPPYGRNIWKWLNKAWEMSATNQISRVICLVPARTDTDWFHNYVWGRANEIVLVHGRIRFEDEQGPAPHTSTFPSMVVAYDGYNYKDSVVTTMDFK